MQPTDRQALPSLETALLTLSSRATIHYKEIKITPLKINEMQHYAKEFWGGPFLRHASAKLGHCCAHIVYCDPVSNLITSFSSSQWVPLPLKPNGQRPHSHDPSRCVVHFTPGKQGFESKHISEMHKNLHIKVIKSSTLSHKANCSSVGQLHHNDSEGIHIRIISLFYPKPR